MMAAAIDYMGTFDVVIVGAGTAGCLLANRLSANPSIKVALLEAGGSDDSLRVRIPAGQQLCIGSPLTDWGFVTEPEPGLNGRSIPYPRGRLLGGCSSINEMVYVRGQRDDYESWCAGDGYGPNPGWGWDDVLPLFRRDENYFGGADAMHGAGGEWRVEKPRVAWEILDAFRQAAAEQGIPRSDDFNRGDNSGCGYFDVNQKRGERLSTARAFLLKVGGRSNLAVFTGAHAKRLLFDGRRCTGVEVARAGRRGVIRVKAELILAAGAVSSPQLLQLSGIGPAALLQGCGITPVHALAGVGANLQDHLQVRMIYAVRGVTTLNRVAASPIAKLGMALQYGLFRRGPLTMSPSQLGAFACSDPSQARPNVEYHVQPLSLERSGDPKHPFPAFTASVCDLRPASRGAVRISSADPLVPPKIAPNYLAAQSDRRVAVDAIRLTRRIVASPALARYAPQEYRPGTEVQSDEDLMHAAGDIGTTNFNPVGTAKMGPAADPMAVVDAELRVHGIAGLRVIDASIMPTITSGDTNAPTLMIAEQGAQFVAGALKRRRA
jgi:choline dehydrogenase